MNSPMNLKWWMVASAAAILLTAPVLGSYDLDAYESAGDDATISRLAQRTAWRYPPFAFCVCFLLAELCLHLFTTVSTPRPFSDWVTIPLFVILPYVVVVAATIAGLRSPGALPPNGPTSFGVVFSGLLFGALSGAVLLHQTGD